MRTLTTLFSVLLLTVGATALAQDGGENQEGQDQAQTTDGEVIEVQMITDGSAYYFDPVGLAIEPGTTVRFINASGMHGTSSYSDDNGKPQRIPDDASGWASPIFNEEGASFEVTFEQEGVYDYYCPPHEALGMVGRIVVGDPAAYPAQDAAQLNFPAAADALPTVDAILGQDDGRLTHEEQQSEAQ